MDKFVITKTMIEGKEALFVQVSDSFDVENMNIIRDTFKKQTNGLVIVTNSEVEIREIKKSILENPVGLTKREYFAGMALQGLVASGSSSVGAIARDCIKLSDALIEELKNESNGGM